MIPRLKPWIGRGELAALLRLRRGAVAAFEAGFGTAFGGQALAFPYGRSALWAFLQAVGLKDAEVVQPAYTCSVVAHATVLSGNVPRFVDASLPTFNTDLDQLADALNERTRAVVATHLFGYPLDVDTLGEIVRDAEVRYGHKIWVVQDCAHAFGARWNGKPVAQAGDAALFGLNVSKLVTSVFGGMLCVADPAVAETVRRFRDERFRRPPLLKGLRRRAYLLATAAAFSERLYGAVHWLQESTPLLDRFTKAYHLDEQIVFPPDAFERMSGVEAEVGLVQLGRYPEIEQSRREHAAFYDRRLPRGPAWEPPPLVPGATYSHYVARVPDRQAMIAALAKRGVHLGQLIEYAVPETAPYRRYAGDQQFPVAHECSRNTVNLPVYATLSTTARERVAEGVGEFTAQAVATPRRAAA